MVDNFVAALECLNGWLVGSLAGRAVTEHVCIFNTFFLGTMSKHN